MKKEVLRINRLSLTEKDTAGLTDVSLCLLEGESCGFLGLENSGKHMMVDVLCGERLWNKGSVYIDGHVVTDKKTYKKSTYYANVSNFFVEDWLVAEYIGLEYTKFPFGILREKPLVHQVKLLMKEIGLGLRVDERVKELSELEKRQMDLVKAYQRGARILIIEDEFEGCTVKDIEKYKEILNRLIKKGGMTAIINSHSDQVSQILSDKFIIFKEGSIVKKCKKNYIKSDAHLEQFLLRQRTTSSKINLERNNNIQDNSKEILYAVSKIFLKKKKELKFHFRKGEITSILILDIELGKKIFRLLSGREINPTVLVKLEGETCNFRKTTDYVKHKIVSSEGLGDSKEMFLTLSVGENLIISSLDKISIWSYPISKYRLEKMAEKQIRHSLTDVKTSIKEMEVNDYITLLLERWYIYKPKVVVLFEPFNQCDMRGISMIKMYLKKFAEMGTTIIIIKSRDEYIEDISDHIVRIL